jgi:hypothetical protein
MADERRDRRRRATKATPGPFPVVARAELGLAEGDAVRFRRRDGERWKDATVARREADGSLGVRDTKGALRALPLELVEVRTSGPRGGVVWEPLTARAARTEKMKLL